MHYSVYKLHFNNCTIHFDNLTVIFSLYHCKKINNILLKSFAINIIVLNSYCNNRAFMCKIYLY